MHKFFRKHTIRERTTRFTYKHMDATR